MTGVLLLLLGSALAGLYGHRPLLWLADRPVGPTTLLTGWVVSTVGLVVSMVATMGLITAPPDRHGSTGLLHLAGGCLTALSSGHLPAWWEILAALSIAASMVILVRIVWAVTHRLRGHRSRAPYIERLRLLAAGVPSGQPL